MPPGRGVVAEHPAFAELCERLGIVFVGPDPGVMRALGDKIEGKRLDERAGVPVTPLRRPPTAGRAVPACRFSASGCLLKAVGSMSGCTAGGTALRNGVGP